MCRLTHKAISWTDRRSHSISSDKDEVGDAEMPAYVMAGETVFDCGCEDGKEEPSHVGGRSLECNDPAKDHFRKRCHAGHFFVSSSPHEVEW